MQSVGFPRIVLQVARKDWAESKGIILLLTFGLLAPALLTRYAPERSADFAKGMLAGLLAGAGYGYAQYCFFNERQRGTLNLLLALPVTPRRLVLAKYLSVFSMTLFTVNAPAILVADPVWVYVVNAAALFLASVFMAASVVSDRPWAAQAPIWLLLVLVFPLEQLLTRYYPAGAVQLEALLSHPILLASGALALIPLLVVLSLRIFEASLD